MYHDRNEVSEMLGATLASVTPSERNEWGVDEVTFAADDGRRWKMWHSYECCEAVELVEVIGDLADLIGSPLVEAEEVISDRGDPAPEDPDSWTWTFYKFRTAKGAVTLRWLGESNGFYSESVDFVQLESGEK